MGGLAAAACAAVLLLLSPQVMRAASDAAEVFAHGVMPALFPMMVLNGLSGRARGGRGGTAATVLLSFMAGSPASALRVAREIDNGRVNLRELPALLAATGVMSPMFFVGTLAARTGLRGACGVMLAAHWLSALAVGLGLRIASAWSSGASANEGARQSMRVHSAMSAPQSAPTGVLAALPSAIQSAAAALLSVCGAMMLFSIAACVVRTLLSLAFPAFASTNARGLAVLWALMEIGGGAYAVLDAFAAPPLPLLCALCSFGGLSICLQNLLFLGESIRPARLLLIRALHGAAAYAICALLLALPFHSFP